MRSLFGILLLSIPTPGLTESGAQLAPPDSLLAYAGVFRIGAAHDVAIVPFRAGRTWMLLLADTQSDALRFLTPAGIDTFTTGPELVVPSPVEWTVTARRHDGVIAAIAMRSGQTSATFDARRVPVETVPVSIANRGTVLNGCLYRPEGRRGRLPLIALAHGSEEADRYSLGPLPLVLAAKIRRDREGAGVSPASVDSAVKEAEDLVAARALRWDVLLRWLDVPLLG